VGQVVLVDSWHGCYRRGWGRELVPEAFAHPAKVSFSLAERIYAHMAAEGWIVEGETVLDPFGGIGGFGYHALKHGLHFIGIELEPKFVDLAAQNITMWDTRYAGRFTRWGTAQVIQGDSRRLADVVREAGATISSPPFSDMVQHDGGPALQQGGELYSDYGSTPGNPGNLRATDAGFDSAISSPPFAEQQTGGGLALEDRFKRDGYQNQAETDGNLAELRATDAGFSAAVSSPPYADGAQHTGGADPGPENIKGGELRYVDYGQSAGQLAAMRADGFDSAVSSPPYEASMSSETSGIDWSKAHWENGEPRDMSIEPGQKNRPGAGTSMRYGSSDGQLSSSFGDDFWHAARAIIEQTYAVLRPGAHAVWVVKSFVRNGALVDFPGQWRQLCEACGFVTLHEHHALLVRDDGTQLAMDGNHKSHRREKKSFFRRLAESKGSPRIDYETVYCMVKEA